MGPQEILALLREEDLQNPVVHAVCALIRSGCDPTQALVDGIKTLVKLNKSLKDQLLDFLYSLPTPLPRFEMHKLAWRVTEAFEYEKWTREIPVLNFPPHVAIKVIPPFGGAVVRFLAIHKEDPRAQVSVYLDCYNMLGIYGNGEPYWEIYPHNDDVARVPLREAEQLVALIIEALEQQRKGES